MRKRVIGSAPQQAAVVDEGWLDFAQLARVEVTSEEASHTIESALLPGGAPGWRAAGPGEQIVRLVFDEPQRLTRIRLVFQEEQTQRTHEFLLQWSADEGRSFREIVRQQWTFSPPDTTGEVEDYRVDLPGVTALELRIVPEITGEDARASLSQLRLA